MISIYLALGLLLVIYLASRFLEKKKVRQQLEVRNSKLDDYEVGLREIDERNNGVTDYYYYVPDDSIYTITSNVDRFNGNNQIQFTAIGSSISPYCHVTTDSDDLVYLNLGLKSVNRKPSLLISLYQKHYKLKEGDVFSVLFSDNEVRHFTINENGNRVDRDSLGILIASTASFSEDDLIRFCEFEIDSYRLSSKEKEIMTAHLDSEAKTKLLYMFRVYRNYSELYEKAPE